MNEKKLVKKKKIAIFVKYGMDSFVKDVIGALSMFYDTKKVVIKSIPECNIEKSCVEIDKEIQWADICWFEWCDELIAYGSNHPMAINKKIICRIHSYEVFTDYPSKVNWDMVDKVIFVAKHIKNQAVESFDIEEEKTIVIPNGIDITKYTFNVRNAGFNIAYVGYINYKKGPMLLLQTFKAIHDSDPRYKLYIAGLFQDDRDVLYFRQMINEWSLEKDIIYQGWQENLDQWLEDKNYILCTSILESQNMSVMQAMSKGIKPIIHNFVGAKDIYPKSLIFNTINEAIEMLSNGYESKDYNNFIQEGYSFDFIDKLLINEIDKLCEEKTKEPLVSIIMAVYNREKYIKEAIESVLNQSYKNIELIIVNDGSTDRSDKIIKSFNDDRIRYFYKDNSGQLPTLKYGFENAEGDYITRVDSDDIIDKDYVKTCVNVMLKDRKIMFSYTDLAVIDKSSNIISEIRLKDYENPVTLIMEVFSGLTSVIPDVSFFKRDYLINVITNYTEQNVPFYIDNIFTTKYIHIKKPMYYYRQHESNFASNYDNLKFVLEGKIKFEDLLIRRYFIQMNLNGNFLSNSREYYKLFSEHYINLRQSYKQLESTKDTSISDKFDELLQLFKDEELYWKARINELDNSSSYNKKNEENSILEDNKNQRALIVSTDNPVEGKAVGGKHTHIHLLVKGLKEQNIPCKLITYKYKNEITINTVNAINYMKQQVNDLILPDDLESSSDILFVYQVYCIQRQLEEQIENALVSNYYSFISCQDVVAAIAAHRVIKRLKFIIPIVTTLHGYFTNENVDYGLLLEGTPVYKYFLKYEEKAYEISDRIITVDTRIKDYVTGLKLIKQPPIHILKNAADNITFSPDENEEEKIDENIILVPRRLVPKNGVIYAVKAANELIKRGIKDFKLIIAGDGIEKQLIEEYIKNNDFIEKENSKNNLKDFVTLLGSVPHDEIQKYYKLARFILIPSIKSNNVEEATSISLLEGMACGKVVVASAIGGMKEIIVDGINGFLVESSNVNVLADKLEEVLIMDENKYRKIGNKARRDVEDEYGYKGHAKKYMNIVEGKMNNVGKK